MSPVKLHVVIPARYASSRFPGKPIIDLVGVPMIVRVYRQVLSALPSCNIIVATDDKRITSVLDEYLVPYVMTNKDHNSGTDRIAEVSHIKNWSKSDVVLNIQGDEPLIPVGLIKKFVDYICSINNFQVATVATPLFNYEELHDKNLVKVVVDKESNALYFSRLPVPCSRDFGQSFSLQDFKRHIGLYAYSIKNIEKITNQMPVFIEKQEKLEQLRILWLGVKISVMCYNEKIPPGVDTKGDADKIVDLLIRQSL